MHGQGQGPETGGNQVSGEATGWGGAVGAVESHGYVWWGEPVIHW